MKKHSWLAAAIVVLCLATLARAQVTKEALPGVTNFARVETTVACAGATTPEAVAEVKKIGFAAVFNLRMANEPGADIEREGEAAKAAGINYFHLPFNGAAPDPVVVDRFLEIIRQPANQPAFIHCASGNRAAAFWLIKRVKLDGWDIDRASSEAAALGLTNGALKQFAIDYLRTHPQ